MTAPNERLLELLADRAVVGLGAREQIELAELLVQAQDVDAGTFDKAAAAIALASVGKLEKMPTGLAERLEQAALGAVDGLRPASDFMQTRALDKLAPTYGATQVDPLVMLPESIELVPEPKDHKRTQTMDGRPALRPEDPPQQPTARDVAPRTHRLPSNPQLPYSVPTSTPSPSPLQPPVFGRPSRVVAISGWIAAAACLLLAIGALARRSPPPPIVSLPGATTTPTAIPSATPAPKTVASTTPAELREKLLAAEGSARAEWSPTKDPLGRAATGEVVWNNELQKGTMRFKGLAKNDSSRAQYQLWIFDKTRDDKYPVDGGVFDVDDETGEVVVPIRATLAVNSPTLFAVTLEKPGGVVVSKRERIVVTAKMPAG